MRPKLSGWAQKVAHRQRRTITMTATVRVFRRTAAISVAAASAPRRGWSVSVALFTGVTSVDPDSAGTIHSPSPA
jgi:hypothetical protein